MFAKKIKYMIAKYYQLMYDGPKRIITFDSSSSADVYEPLLDDAIPFTAGHWFCQAFNCF